MESPRYFTGVRVKFVKNRKVLAFATGASIKMGEYISLDGKKFRFTKDSRFLDLPGSTAVFYSPENELLGEVDVLNGREYPDWVAGQISSYIRLNIA